MSFSSEIVLNPDLVEVEYIQRTVPQNLILIWLDDATPTLANSDTGTHYALALANNIDLGTWDRDSTILQCNLSIVLLMVIKVFVSIKRINSIIDAAYTS